MNTKADPQENLVKVGKPVYHRKRKYFTLPATGDKVHEVNLDYLVYPLYTKENKGL